MVSLSGCVGRARGVLKYQGLPLQKQQIENFSEKHSMQNIKKYNDANLN